MAGDSQHGFTKGILCLTNLAAFSDRVMKLLDEERGTATGIVYLDWYKAFDTAPQDIQTDEMHMTDGPDVIKDIAGLAAHKELH